MNPRAGGQPVDRESTGPLSSPSRHPRAPSLDAILILIGSGCLVCLMPLALYLLYLSHLNGRTPPPLIPGPWDFAAVLLGLSGFLILAGPVLLTLVHSTWRSYAYGGWADLKGIGKWEAIAASSMAVGYLLVVGAGAALLIKLRRPVTAIYNVAPDGIEPSLTGALDELGYPWRRAAGMFVIGLKNVTELTEPGTGFFPHETATVRVDRFPATSHATLRWGGEAAGLRREVEPVLARSLTVPVKNPVAGWMFTAAVSVMVTMLLWLVVLIYLVMTPAPT